LRGVEIGRNQALDNSEVIEDGGDELAAAITSLLESEPTVMGGGTEVVVDEMEIEMVKSTDKEEARGIAIQEEVISEAQVSSDTLAPNPSAVSGSTESITLQVTTSILDAEEVATMIDDAQAVEVETTEACETRQSEAKKLDRVKLAEATDDLLKRVAIGQHSLAEKLAAAYAATDLNITTPPVKKIVNGGDSFPEEMLAVVSHQGEKMNRSPSELGVAAAHAGGKDVDVVERHLERGGVRPGGGSQEPMNMDDYLKSSHAESVASRKRIADDDTDFSDAHVVPPETKKLRHDLNGSDPHDSSMTTPRIFGDVRSSSSITSPGGLEYQIRGAGGAVAPHSAQNARPAMTPPEMPLPESFSSLWHSSNEPPVFTLGGSSSGGTLTSTLFGMGASFGSHPPPHPPVCAGLTTPQNNWGANMDRVIDEVAKGNFVRGHEFNFYTTQKKPTRSKSKDDGNSGVKGGHEGMLGMSGPGGHGAPRMNSAQASGLLAVGPGFRPPGGGQGGYGPCGASSENLRYGVPGMHQSLGPGMNQRQPGLLQTGGEQLVLVNFV